jgi:membrane peptidoglycan carboxypeptidase
MGESGEGEAWVLRCAAGDGRCAALNETALRALEATGLNGVAVVTRAADGRIEAYAARGVAGGPQPGVPAAAPGSLAKLALAAAWWERGHDERLVPCPPVTKTTRGARVDAVGATARSLAPRDVLALSCNTAAAAMAAELARERGAGALQDALAPLVGTTAAGNAVADWELQAVGIGPLETDPLRVAAFLHAVAGDGLARQPWAGAPPAAPPRRLFAPATAAALRAALAAAVERGTARSLGEAQRGQGWRLAGKTGTVAGPGERVDGWFAALASDEAGRAERAVVVWLQDGGSGGGRPARLALELARAARR